MHACTQQARHTERTRLFVCDTLGVPSASILQMESSDRWYAFYTCSSWCVFVLLDVPTTHPSSGVNCKPKPANSQDKIPREPSPCPTQELEGEGGRHSPRKTAGGHHHSDILPRPLKAHVLRKLTGSPEQLGVQGGAQQCCCCTPEILEQENGPQQIRRDFVCQQYALRSGRLRKKLIKRSCVIATRCIVSRGIFVLRVWA